LSTETIRQMIYLGVDAKMWIDFLICKLDSADSEQGPKQ